MTALDAPTGAAVTAVDPVDVVDDDSAGLAVTGGIVFVTDPDATTLRRVAAG